MAPAPTPTIRTLTEIRQVLHKLSFLALTETNGTIAFLDPSPIPPGIEKQADSWIEQFLLNILQSPQPPNDIRFSLLNRSRVALHYLKRVPWPAGQTEDAIVEPLRELLIRKWHGGFYAAWLRGLESGESDASAAAQSQPPR